MLACFTRFLGEFGVHGKGSRDTSPEIHWNYLVQGPHIAMVT